MGLAEYLSTQQKKINTFLDRIIPSPGQAHSQVYKAVRYSVFAGGKRIRPVLSLSVSDVVDGDEQTALAAGCAVEMVHSYSLIHDDLPCMDDDDFRRGHPSLHKQFDYATAVLAGDALQTMAFELISEEIKDPAQAILFVSELSRAAGPEGMIGGQVLDILYEKDASGRGLEQLKDLHSRKTGAIITASVMMGAYSGDCTDEELEHLREFGRYVGMLFQVTDDILDVTGDFNKLGKTVGKDSEADKLTFPALLGMHGAKEYRDEVYNNACKSLEIFGKRGTILNELCTFVKTRDY